MFVFAAVFSDARLRDLSSGDDVAVCLCLNPRDLVCDAELLGSNRTLIRCFYEAGIALLCGLRL